jgi:hypothetical protein
MYATGCPLHELVVQGKPLTHEAIKSITQDNDSGVLQRTHTLPFGSETPITTILRSNKNSSTVECSLFADRVKIETDKRKPMQRLGDSLLRFSGRFAHTFWQDSKNIISGMMGMIPKGAHYYNGVTFAEWTEDVDYFHNNVSSYLDLMRSTSLTNNLAIGSIDAEEFSSKKEIHRLAAYPFKSKRLITTILENGSRVDFDRFFRLHTIRKNNTISNLRDYSLIQLSDIRNLLIDIQTNIEDPKMPNVIFVNGPVHITKPLKKFGFMSVREIGDDKNLTRMKLETGEADTLVFAVNETNLTKAIMKIALIQKRINKDWSRTQNQTKSYTNPVDHYGLVDSSNPKDGYDLLPPNIKQLVEKARRDALSNANTNDQVTETIKVNLLNYGLKPEQIEFIFNHNLNT